jgi:hypothetical protein
MVVGPLRGVSSLAILLAAGGCSQHGRRSPVLAVGITNDSTVAIAGKEISLPSDAISACRALASFRESLPVDEDGYPDGHVRIQLDEGVSAFSLWRALLLVYHARLRDVEVRSPDLTTRLQLAHDWYDPASLAPSPQTATLATTAGTVVGSLRTLSVTFSSVRGGMAGISVGAMEQWRERRGDAAVCEVIASIAELADDDTLLGADELYVECSANWAAAKALGVIGVCATARADRATYLVAEGAAPILRSVAGLDSEANESGGCCGNGGQ